MSDFPEFPKIARLSRDCTITEKLDGTNVLIRVHVDGETITAGSRTRWITPEDDNYGFAQWVCNNRSNLLKLGPGDHYGEWWGSGIQKRYVNQPKTFSLFNTHRWADEAVRPKCCSLVPVLYQGVFCSTAVDFAMQMLMRDGSKANPECKRPEGIIIWHHAAQTYFKKTIEKDTEWKGKNVDVPQALTPQTPAPQADTPECNHAWVQGTYKFDDHTRIGDIACVFCGAKKSQADTEKEAGETCKHEYWVCAAGAMEEQNRYGPRCIKCGAWNPEEI